MTREDEEAGAREHFEDAALYDFEYRRRRADVRFYRSLAETQGGPILDLACGSGRLLVPLLRDGHVVVGLDRSGPMLARAAARIGRLTPARRARALLVRGDLRAFAFRRPFALAVSAFHSVQHLLTDDDLVAFFRAVRASLRPGGWFAFDVLPPNAAWIARDPNRRWARTIFKHPTTGQRLAYTENHRYDARRRVLHMRIYYAPVDETGRRKGRERVVRICHRQLTLAEVQALLGHAGLELRAAYGGFDGRVLDGESDEHVYLARRSPTENGFDFA